MDFVERTNSENHGLAPALLILTQSGETAITHKLPMQKEIQIGNQLVGDGHPCYLIGEIGINHNGSLDLAKNLISVAKNAGWDAVKFQKRTIDIVYTAEELAKPRENPFGATNGDLKRGLEFGIDQYRKIDEFCREMEIPWFAS